MVESGGNVQATMPYYRPRPDQIAMPLLTQTMGPWLWPLRGKYCQQLAEQKRLMGALIDQLPPVLLFRQNFHHSLTNWLPFFWRGFRQTTRYTYIIDSLHDLEAVFLEFKSSVRGKIRKAQRIIRVREGDLEELYRLNVLTFARQSLPVPYTLEFLCRQDESLSQRGRRKILIAEGHDGRVHSGLYLIWDAMSSYVHIVGEDPELRSSGAGSLLVWEAIQYTARELQLSRLDFEGSMVESVEEVRRAMGAKQSPYSCVYYDRRNLLQKTRWAIRGRVAARLRKRDSVRERGANLRA